MSSTIKSEDLKREKSILNPPSVPTDHTTSHLKKKIRFTEEKNGTICILSDNENDDDSTGTINLLDDNTMSDGDDDAIIILESTPSSSHTRLTKYSEAQSNIQGDDEVVAVADSLMKLPHMRQHCTMNKFVTDVSLSSTHDGFFLMS